MVISGLSDRPPVAIVQLNLGSSQKEAVDRPEPMAYNNAGFLVVLPPTRSPLHSERGALLLNRQNTVSGGYRDVIRPHGAGWSTTVTRRIEKPVGQLSSHATCGKLNNTNQAAKQATASGLISHTLFQLIVPRTEAVPSNR